MAFALSSCDSITLAEGQVLDAADRPLAGALVILRRVGGPPDSLDSFVRTDSAGRFEVMIHGGWLSPDALLSACAPGHAPVEMVINDQAFERGLTLALRDGEVAGGLCVPPRGAWVIGEPPTPRRTRGQSRRGVARP